MIQQTTEIENVHYAELNFKKVTFKRYAGLDGWNKKIVIMNIVRIAKFIIITILKWFAYIINWKLILNIRSNEA